MFNTTNNYNTTNNNYYIPADLNADTARAIGIGMGIGMGEDVWSSHKDEILEASKVSSKEAVKDAMLVLMDEVLTKMEERQKQTGSCLE
ncbi:MAG: hypothetical protein FWE67_07255 [Planctomycetaceae bacterium]|nr:hypothetical protein [Planctomycetaceae bacterium]